MKVSERIAALRTRMRAAGLDAYLVPSADPHQSEYVAACWQRRGFISGFDGSAGTVAVLAERAGLWTDSRYFLQAAEQLAGSGIELFRMGEPGVPELEPFLAQNLPAGARVGLDPRVFSEGACQRLEEALTARGVLLAPQEEDLVEAVWGAGRPALPTAPLRTHALSAAGVDAGAKLTRLRTAMQAAGVDAVVLAALDEIAWLTNLRGADVPFNPVFIAYLVVEPRGARLLVDPAKLGAGARAALPADLEVLPYERFGEVLDGLGRAGAGVWIDPATVSRWTAARLRHAGARLLQQPNPVPAWKAVKNEAELAGARAAHLRDGVAMARFLAWLEQELPRGRHTEASLAERLEGFRREAPGYLGPSFETIAGYGAHGAIVHYRVSAESDVPVAAEGVLLLDSGGQYLDGTTDITRTLGLGGDLSAARREYTAVLQGHLALGRARFLAGTNGYQLDALARAPLWAAGLHYGHGTGHGVGAALCVHEGPFSVSLRRNLTALEPGHVLSIEPGVYVEGARGIRVENLAVVVPAGDTPHGRFLGFEWLTLCPYDRRLIEPELLSPAERRQVDDYHARVRDSLGPHLDEPARAWLDRATRPL
ncbi:MAG TPA: aminopeptidase P family protein [Myxococcota bacterium]|nr:aminopeptidase P family protein [Myxococcota bacterium]HRY92392.1 aminopeptidase P family protein [Myxococcota bacterium]